MVRMIALATALVLAPAYVCAATPPPRPGDVYSIQIERESTTRDEEGSRGTTFDRDTLIERVVAVRPDGVELEYDLPPSVSDDQRAADWQLPVRIFRPALGPLRLLNSAELEARVDPWLEAAGLTRAACGRWIFTWNAFRIECDPDSAIAMIAPFQINVSEVADGALYADSSGVGQRRLQRERAGATGATFTAEFDLDPETVRRERMEAVAAVATMTGASPATIRETLIGAAEDDVITGKISVTLETDAAGEVWRRTRLIEVRISANDGRTERVLIRETLERRPVTKGS